MEIFRVSAFKLAFLGGLGGLGGSSLIFLCGLCGLSGEAFVFLGALAVQKKWGRLHFFGGLEM
jgi:hypothetical protein